MSDPQINLITGFLTKKPIHDELSFQEKQYSNCSNKSVIPDIAKDPYLMNDMVSAIQATIKIPDLMLRMDLLENIIDAYKERIFVDT